jgi:hypothetical protein
MTSLLDAALQYAAHGWRVFPLVPGAKQPLTAHGFRDATTDEDQILSWWSSTPEANIGIATGRGSGIVVLDIDMKNAKDGYTSAKELGIDPADTPVQVVTASRGAHLYFAYDAAIGNSASKLGVGLDTRGEGGYVVVPPSQIKGQPYMWLGSFKQPPSKVPAAMIEKMQAPASLASKRTTDDWLHLLDGVGEGSRQDTLPRIVGKLYASAPDFAMARALAHLWNERNQPPLSAKEVDECCDRIERKEDAKGNQADFISLADVEMTPIPWLWPGYLPQGAVTLLVGDPGKGKTLVSLDLAARVSAGKPWPDETPNTHGPATVIVLTAEDDLGYTVRPRIEVAGGDVSRIKVVNQSIAKPTLSLTKSLDWLKQEIEQSGVMLLVIDPLSAYMPGVDCFKDNEVRSHLAPFVQLTQQHGVTVLAIVHMSKNIERGALQRVLGSTAFVALARATFMVSLDPEDEEQRLFTCPKCNLSRYPQGLTFHIMEQGLSGGIIAPVAVWDGTTDLHPDEVLRKLVKGRPESTLIESDILDALAQGPVPVKELETHLEMNERTRRRYGKKLGIE